MSEIHRYKAVKILTEVGNNISYTPHGPDVVMAADFDRVTAERDALQALLDESDELCDSLERSMKNHRHELGLAQRRLTVPDVVAGAVDSFWRVAGSPANDGAVQGEHRHTGAGGLQAEVGCHSNPALSRVLPDSRISHSTISSARASITRARFSSNSRRCPGNVFPQAS